MSTKPSITIDDIGLPAYQRFESDKESYDETYLSESKNVAMQTTTDVVSPILISEHDQLFELGIKGATWGNIEPPPKFDQQKKRLFTHQLAPKLGPEDVLDMQIDRINGKRNQFLRNLKRKDGPNWEYEKKQSEITKEADTIIEMMHDINARNKMLAQINAERYRYSKG